jgi:hypothetical protein
VLLNKPKGDPGVALHFNTSTTLNNPAGTVFDHGTQVAHHESYLGAGKHAPVVMAGRNTGLVDGDTGFLSYAKTVFIEGRNAVMHGVDASVNALWSLLPAALQTTVENTGQIAAGLSAQEDAQALLAGTQVHRHADRTGADRSADGYVGHSAGGPDRLYTKQLRHVVDAQPPGPAYGVDP